MSEPIVGKRIDRDRLHRAAREGERSLHLLNLDDAVTDAIRRQDFIAAAALRDAVAYFARTSEIEVEEPR